MVKSSAWEFVYTEDVPKLKAIQQKSAVGETVRFPNGCRIVREDGQIIDIEFHLSPIHYQGKPANIGTILDVTETKQIMDTHAFLAHHDPLTNLPNRRMFEQNVDQSLIIARTCNQKLAVMYVDLDRFKYINDTLGHEIGDQLLQCVAKRLKKSLRAEDVVARIGGTNLRFYFPW
jgi:GGDEF domain-containing protein